MDTTSYLDLAALPEVRRFEESFRSAFGVSVSLVSSAIPLARIGLGPEENPLCVLVAGMPRGCECCLSAQLCLQRNLSKRRSAQQVSCAAGLTEVAVPVIVGGRHVATLWSGQVLSRGPTERDFQLLVQMKSPGEVTPSWSRDLRNAYFATQVITAENLTSLTRMLTIFARFLAEAVGARSIDSKADEHDSVVRAKQFINNRLSEQVDLESVVNHVGLSRYYFCRLFKKTTGMTLSAFVARARMERAKDLLAAPDRRISEIAYAIGFRSVPRFNSLFKLHVGMAPSAFRELALTGMGEQSVSTFQG